jgi:hypothetical protein
MDPTEMRNLSIRDLSHCDMYKNVYYVKTEAADPPPPCYLYTHVPLVKPRYILESLPESVMFCTGLSIPQIMEPYIDT